MEMKKRIIKGCAWALALLTAVSVLALKQDAAYGATGVDANKERSLSFSLARNVGGEGIPEEDLKQDITIRYYKVAEMNVPTGTYSGKLQGNWAALKTVKYKVVERADKKGFDVKVDGVDKDYGACKEEEQTADLEDVILDTSEEGRTNATFAWDALAKKAAAISENEQEFGHVVLKNTADEAFAAEVSLEEVPPAMYLIMAEDVKASNYMYSFKPYLISVPTNGYADGTADSDDWIYDVKVGLKPEQEERYGRLRITKNLSDFNASLGDKASFIFEVRAEKDGDLVYSDVVQLDFTGAGQNTVTIGPEEADGVDVVGKIPAGSTVTVTEVYSGASYEAATDTVRLDHPMQAYDEEHGVAENVSFTTTYNGGINGGSGVVNHFEYTESENGTGGNWQYVPSQSAEGGNTQ